MAAFGEPLTLSVGFLPKWALLANVRLVVFDYAGRYRDAARELAGWMTAGRLRSHEHIV